MPPALPRPRHHRTTHRTTHRPWLAAAGRAVLLALAAGASALAGAATPAGVAPGLMTDAELAASLAAIPAPLQAPRAAIGLVVPAQVARWREEAQALEHGDNGLPRDPARAATLYCQAARYGDAEAQFSLAWMLTNGRGIERDDAQAAHLFAAAAEQGMPQAQRMAASLGTPRGVPPPCLRPPPPPAPPTAAPATAVARAERPPAGSRPGAPQATAVGVAANATEAALAAVPLPPNAPPPLVNFVKLMAPDYRLAPGLVLAFMATESNFNAGAVSPKNALGLMQLIPDTATRFGVRNPMDPAQNIRGGMAYLRWLMAYFEGDVALVAAAYNAGERAVERYRGVPPYAETLHYVARILGQVGALKQPFDPKIVAPSDLLPLMREPLKRR
jgi:soluble lytic murein transglycosylase-like protein